MTLRVLGQEEQTFGPGEMWHERVGRPHRAGNDTDEPARITVTFIIAENVPVTTPVE